MKINATGIDAYRNILSDNQVGRKQVGPENKIEQSGKVQIPVQDKAPGSKLGVNLKSGSFADMLSPEEKQALEMIFEKFRGAEGRSYEENGASDKPRLGNIVDIKL
ncbi:hypothetical protein TRIP_C30035 [Candidatus Zixiibacteriota bacterium]|nr:hypothetical protein TRIP_C30035 [candidate division Zixibacteria bacterium]